MRTGDIAADQTDLRLLRSIAEQLKLPLSIIARQTELVHIAGIDEQYLETVDMQAKAALQLVDSYLLGLSFLQDQTTLPIEPLSISAVMEEAAQELYGFATQYDVHMELYMNARGIPVLGHRQALKAAFIVLGQSFIGGQQSSRSNRLVLAAHRTVRGLAGGFYAEHGSLGMQQWRRALGLYGNAAKPFSTLCAGSGAGVFVADALIQAMNGCLYAGHHQRKEGLIALLKPSHQLRLV